RQSSGAILLGFHLGPPKTWLALRSLGYPVRVAARLEGRTGDARWAAAFAAEEAMTVGAAAAGDRANRLLRIRNLLRKGPLLHRSADGPLGRDAFHIDLPGGSLVVRGGWLALRRALDVTTIPVLTHREARRRVIVVHPPLPPYQGDARRDAEACREALTPL